MEIERGLALTCAGGGGNKGLGLAESGYGKSIVTNLDSGRANLIRSLSVSKDDVEEKVDHSQFYLRIN
ncbi:hypothetical protein J6590_026213 [Homalodisca vitripennis]|nr:hypothetical protein J6590_026213 [Homalodisca vitripennis]